MKELTAEDVALVLQRLAEAESDARAEALASSKASCASWSEPAFCG
jgi:hypothetical protein